MGISCVHSNTKGNPCLIQRSETLPSCIIQLLWSSRSLNLSMIYKEFHPSSCNLSLFFTSSYEWNLVIFLPGIYWTPYPLNEPLYRFCCCFLQGTANMYWSNINKSNLQISFINSDNVNTRDCSKYQSHIIVVLGKPSDT